MKSRKNTGRGGWRPRVNVRVWWKRTQGGRGRWTLHRHGREWLRRHVKLWGGVHGWNRCTDWKAMGTREENAERHGSKHREGIILSQTWLRRSPIPTIIETD